MLKLGDAIIFRSGGKEAVVHGSFRFDAREKQTDLPRMSMEFRCQYKDPIDGFGHSENGPLSLNFCILKIDAYHT